MENFDVVIVGLGAAGTMTAHAVVEAGLTCAVLEKGRNYAACNAARAGGPALAETRLQEEQGATVTREQLFDHMYRYTRGTVHAGLLRNAIDKGSRVEEILLEAGINLELWPDTYGVGFRAREFMTTPPYTRWKLLSKKIEDGTGKIYFRTSAERLLMDASGKVTGVSAKQFSEDGGERKLEFGAKAVVIASGGYLGNEKMIREHFGNVHVGALGSRLSDGTGIQMVLGAGGLLDRSFGICANEFCGFNSKAGKRNSSNMYYAIAGGLLVNQQGRRFLNEQYMSDQPLCIGGEITLREGRFYAVVDEEAYRALGKGTIYDFYGRPEEWNAGKTTLDRELSWKEEDFCLDERDGFAFSADSVEELSRKTGIPGLAKTVEDYNRMCEAGRDTVFGKASYLMKPVKKAPFYAFEYETSAWCTFGGVKTDEFCRALNADHEVIPGLYAAGVDNGSCYCVPYYDNEGAALGLAFTLGLVAGEHIVGKLKKEKTQGGCL